MQNILVSTFVIAAGMGLLVFRQQHAAFWGGIYGSPRSRAAYVAQFVVGPTFLIVIGTLALVASLRQ